MRKVAVFLNHCLPLSEVFVAHQAKALQRYAPTLVACRKSSPSVETGLPEVILNQDHSLHSKALEAFFKATGYNRDLQKAVNDSDIVHAHFGPTGWLASGLAKRAKKPLIVTLHGFDVLKKDITVKKDGLLQAVYAQNRKKLAERAFAFICVSEYVKKRAIEFGFPADKCHVLYMGIPLPEAAIVKETRNPNEPYRLIAAGRLVPFKGHKKLIDAVALVQQSGYNVRLDIAGDGPLRAELEAQAARSLKDYKFHGALPHHQILSLMRNSDIFCHTSMHMENGQTEAFGLVLLEAQWNGLPVIAFDSGGVPEAMQENETGLLCPEGDAVAFASAIKNLIDNPDRREHMSANAPQFVKANFDTIQQTAKLENLYDQLIGARS